MEYNAPSPYVGYNNNNKIGHLYCVANYGYTDGTVQKNYNTKNSMQPVKSM